MEKILFLTVSKMKILKFIKKITHFWQIVSRNHKFFGTKVTSLEEKSLAAENCRKFTKVFPIYFPDMNITRKMHNLSFFVPLVIENDKTENICYKYLKIEQAGKKSANEYFSRV